jgi:hypothetical protein
MAHQLSDTIVKISFVANSVLKWKMTIAAKAVASPRLPREFLMTKSVEASDFARPQKRSVHVGKRGRFFHCFFFASGSRLHRDNLPRDMDLA